MKFIGYGNYCSYDEVPVSFFVEGRDLLYVFECNQQTVVQLLCHDDNYKKYVRPKSGIVIFATSLHPISWSGIMPFLMELAKKEDTHPKSVTVVIPNNEFIDYLIDNHPFYHRYDSQHMCLSKISGVIYDIVKVSNVVIKRITANLDVVENHLNNVIHEDGLLFEENGKMVKKVRFFHRYDEIKSYSVLLTKSNLNPGVMYTGYEGTDITRKDVRKIFADYDIDNFVISINGTYSYPTPMIEIVKHIPFSLRPAISFVNTRSYAERSWYNYALREYKDESSKYGCLFDGGTKE